MVIPVNLAPSRNPSGLRQRKRQALSQKRGSVNIPG